MKNLFKLALMLFAVATFVACNNQPAETEEEVVEEPAVEETAPEVQEDTAMVMDTPAEEGTEAEETETME